MPIRARDIHHTSEFSWDIILMTYCRPIDFPLMRQRGMSLRIDSINYSAELAEFWSADFSGVVENILIYLVIAGRRLLCIMHRADSPSTFYVDISALYNVSLATHERYQMLRGLCRYPYDITLLTRRPIPAPVYIDEQKCIVISGNMKIAGSHINKELKSKREWFYKLPDTTRGTMFTSLQCILYRGVSLNKKYESAYYTPMEKPPYTI